MNTRKSSTYVLWLHRVIFSSFLRPQGFLSRLQSSKTIILYGIFSYFFFSFCHCRTWQTTERFALFGLNDEVIRFPAFTQLRYFLGIWHATGCAASRRYIFIWPYCCVLSRHNMYTHARYSFALHLSLFLSLWPHFFNISRSSDVNQILEEIIYYIVSFWYHMLMHLFISRTSTITFVHARSLAFTQYRKHELNESMKYQNKMADFMNFAFTCSFCIGIHPLLMDIINYHVLNLWNAYFML